ncbi:AAA family ATPase [Thauera mechernichensis]|uniref:AAA family ATPase n=1 Tax=Thauera mechernichensis TaxID=82788 RepID=A0ABW3WJ71_9RHOO|nr:AAA family ATPase [Thauera mechernichensis]MDG3065992.1 AAA family ATPase [Thauera mechernichensis]
MMMPFLNGVFRLLVLVCALLQVPLWLGTFGVFSGQRLVYVQWSTFFSLAVVAAGVIALVMLLLRGARAVPELGRLTLFVILAAVSESLIVGAGYGLAVAAGGLSLAWMLGKLTPAQIRTLAHPTGDRLAEAAASGEPMFRAELARYSFVDVVGMGELKSRLAEAGAEVKASKTGATARNGVLLFGEPGNGKSFFAEALAGELKLPLIAVSVADVASRWVNQTPEMIAQLFADARAQAPCVLFLDEADSLMVDRAQIQRADSEEAKATNALLAELTKIRGVGVLVIAATNHLDRLDTAAVREGRFDFKIEVPAPDLEARCGLLTAARRGRIRLDEDAIDRASRRWAGFSVARIRAVADEALRTAEKFRELGVDYKTLKLALRSIQGRAGKLPEAAPLLEDLSFSSAQKEALHALAARMTHAEEIEDAGGTVPAGVLFYGPPGTGKTVTAQSLAKTAGWAFVCVTGNELLSNPDRLVALMREARELRPVVVFIDEADDVLGRRAGNHPALVSITNSLLSAIDGAGGRTPDVLWIAATNYPEQLDPAALRGGRLAEKIEFLPPDVDALREFVGRFFDASPAQWAGDCAQAVPQLLGLALADVGAVLQQAVTYAAVRKLTSGSASAVCLADIQAALRHVLGEV